jgi:hypothetical protein
VRTGIAYTCARILLLVAALELLHLAGIGGIALFLLAFVISGLASYVLLSRQRDAMSSAASKRLSRVSGKVAEFRGRLEEGAAAEDEDDDKDEPAGVAETAKAGTSPERG